MRTLKSVLVLGGACLATAALFAACGDSGSPGAAPSSNGAAGQSGQAGAGAASGSAGSGPAPSAGTGGSAGAGGTPPGSGGAAGAMGGQGGAGGGKGGAAGPSATGGMGGASATGGMAGAASYAKPVWKELGGTTNGCTGLTYLTNPSEIGPVWTWSACASAIKDCQQLTLSGPLSFPGKIRLTSAAYDDGVDKWIALRYDGGTRVRFVVAKADGSAVVALDAPDQTVCDFGEIAVGNGHYGVTIGSTVVAAPDTAEDGAVVGALAATKPAISQLTLTPKIIYPWMSALYGGRAYWKEGMGSSISSCDWELGTDRKGEVDASVAGGEISDIVATPDGVLFSVRRVPHVVLARLGAAKPGMAVTYLTDPDADLMFPVFTGSHLTWLRGEGHQPDETYTTLTLWTSSYSSSGLTPTVLAVWPWHAATDLAGAHDHVAMADGIAGADQISVHTWHVPDGEHRMVHVDPAYVAGGPVAGIWHDEVVFPVAAKNATSPYTLYRVPIASMPVVP